MIEITELKAAQHWDKVWSFMKPVFEAGDSYPNAVDISKSDALAYWTAPGKKTFVAINKSGQIVGIYYIRPNQPPLGAHICNCGYVVDTNFRGQGIATRMCEHSQDYARKAGYRGMQYNLVVSTNTGAVRLWQSLGFDIIGTVPEAFKHKMQGYVDAHIMFKSLI